MTETKVMQVRNDVDDINECNEMMGKFGWKVLSVQVTHSQNTKTYTGVYDYGTGNQTVETTTINYATITYQRDRDMRNYAQIAALEQEYDLVATEIHNMKEKMVEERQVNWLFVIFLISVWPIGVAYVVYKILGRNKKKALQAALQAERENKIETNKKRMEQILIEADRLLVI